MCRINIRIVAAAFAAVFALTHIVFAENDAETAVDDTINESPTVKEPKPSKSADGGRRERPEGTDFRLSGILETGFDIHHRVNNSGVGSTENRALARGEIEISARPVRRLRAEIGIEYNHRDTFVTVDKFYAQYNPSRDGTIRAGIMKKAFGLEERAGASERYFYRRSTINGELEVPAVNDISNVGFLGHDLTLMYRHDINKSIRLVGAYSWSLEDSLVLFQNYSAQYDKDSLLVVLAAIVRHRVPESGATTTFASSLSARYGTRRAVGEAELTLATHPWFSENQGQTSYIYGLRLQGQFPIDIDTETLRRIVPIAEVAMLYKEVPGPFDHHGNLSAYSRLDTQFRAGLTLAFTKNSQFQWRNTFGTILRMQTDDNNEWQSMDRRRYRFDSQAVVIF